MLFEEPYEWIAETPLGPYGVHSFHSHYSFLIFGPVHVRIGIGFEKAKIAYPIVSIGLLFIIICAIIGFKILSKKFIKYLKRRKATPLKST